MQDFLRRLYKIQGVQGLEFGPIKFKAFQAPVRTLIMTLPRLPPPTKAVTHSVCGWLAGEVDRVVRRECVLVVLRGIHCHVLGAACEDDTRTYKYEVSAVSEPSPWWHALEPNDSCNNYHSNLMWHCSAYIFPAS